MVTWMRDLGDYIERDVPARIPFLPPSRPPACDPAMNYEVGIIFETDLSLAIGAFWIIFILWATQFGDHSVFF